MSPTEDIEQPKDESVVRVKKSKFIEETIPPPIKYRALKRFYANKAAAISVVFLIVVLILCYFPQLITEFAQNEQTVNKRVSPNSTNWLGTDILGRDILTELLFAGQITLRIAIAVGIVSTLIGSVLGAVAGYYHRIVDSFLMRLTDLFLVVPQLVILALALRKFGDEYLSMVIIISLISWMYTARLVRSQVLSLKSREYIDAAKMNGRSSIYIVFRHLIPGSWSVIAVSSAFTIAGAILLESTVSFLGYGVQAPLTSWGRMLYDFKGFAVGKYFYLFLSPALAIFFTVLAFNFISDGLRDAFDPRSEQS